MTSVYCDGSIMNDATMTVNEIPLSETVQKTQMLEPQTIATFKKNVICYDVIKDFSIKDKRRVFSDMRGASIQVTTNTFFPRYGFTSGEFSTWTVLTESNRKRK